MPNLDTVDFIGAFLLFAALITITVTLVNWPRVNRDCPDCRLPIPECRCQTADACQPCAGDRAGLKACRQAWLDLQQAAARLEAAANYEGSPWVVGAFVGPIRATADELHRAIERCQAMRRSEAAAENRLVIPAFKESTGFQDEARVIRVDGQRRF